MVVRSLDSVQVLQLLHCKLAELRKLEGRFAFAAGLKTELWHNIEQTKDLLATLDARLQIQAVWIKG